MPRRPRRRTDGRSRPFCGQRGASVGWPARWLRSLPGGVRSKDWTAEEPAVAVFRRPLRFACLTFVFLVVVAACGRDDVTVRAGVATDGVVVVETSAMTTIGAADDYLVAFDRFTAAKDNVAPGTIFDGEGKRVASVSDAPFRAPLMGLRVQHDGGNTVLVVGQECADAKVNRGGDPECSGLTPAVARLDLEANRWSDYGVLDDPSAPKDDDPMLSAVEVLGFSGLIRVSMAGHDSLWLRERSDTWVLVASEPTVPSSGWCATADRIYRGPPVALATADTIARVESAPFPTAGREPTPLHWTASGPVSAVPRGEPKAEVIDSAMSLSVGCLESSVNLFATEELPDRTVLQVAKLDSATGPVAWAPFMADPDVGTALVGLVEGPDTLALRIRRFEKSDSATLRIVDEYEVFSSRGSIPIAPSTELTGGDTGDLPIVRMIPRSDNSWVVVRVAK